MKIEIKIPALGESIVQVTVGNILKTSGMLVKADDELLELETDKLNQVLYAPADGVLTLQLKQGDVIKIGDVVGFIETTTEKVVEAEKPTPAPVTPSVAIAPTITSPANGAKQELLLELEGRPKVIAQENAPLQVMRKPLSRLRQVMAERLLKAAQTTAMLTTFNEADMSEIIKLRETYKELFTSRHKVKLGFMSFFVKACTSALHAFPQVNSYLDGTDQVFRQTIDISIAVSSDRGLIVPVLKECEKLSFAEIEQKIADFSSRANTGALSLDELVGGGFTITNGGTFGSMMSTPIINPPQTAILGMHKISKRAVVVDDQIVIRPMMYLALSYDHRVLDGKEAVSFLVHIKNMLEDPHRLELGV